MDRHTNRQTHGQIEKRTGGEMNRQTDAHTHMVERMEGETDRQTDRQTHTHIYILKNGQKEN